MDKVDKVDKMPGCEIYFYIHQVYEMDIEIKKFCEAVAARLPHGRLTCFVESPRRCCLRWESSIGLLGGLQNPAYYVTETPDKITPRDSLIVVESAENLISKMYDLMREQDLSYAKRIIA